MDETDRKTIERLVKAINKSYSSTKHLIFRSFISGIFYGLGATIGLAIVLFLLGILVTQLSHIPFIGDYFQYIQDLLHQRPLHQ